MALRIEDVRAPARTPIFAIPQPPTPTRLPRAKSGKVKHPKVCPKCKAGGMNGHREGCAAYAESQLRLFQWGRYDRWLRAELGDEAFFKTDLSAFDLTRLPAPDPVCATCGERKYPDHCSHVEYSRSYSYYGSGAKTIPPTADHEFVAGSTPGLHPLSNDAIQFGPSVVMPAPLILTPGLRTMLAEAARCTAAATPAYRSDTSDPRQASHRDSSQSTDAPAGNASDQAEPAREA